MGVLAPTPTAFSGIGARTLEYPSSAANFFGEPFAHRLRWAHAVNSRRRLRAVLCTDAHFLEADVAAGPVFSRKDEVFTLPSSGSGASSTVYRSLGTDVVTEDGQAVIMAHYPTERSSDLTLESFIRTVLVHNEYVDEQFSDFAAQVTAPLPTVAEVSHSESDDPAIPAAASLANSDRKRNLRSPFSNPVEVEELADDHATLQSSAATTDLQVQHSNAGPHCEEAAAFARDLHKELDAQAQVHGHMITACVGTRRDYRMADGSRPTRKGVKLDFKLFECVLPALRYLREVDAAGKLRGHLWLNGDIFAGPGALISPLDAKQFVRLCAEWLPEAVLSLSWGSSVLSTSRLYTDEMVDAMIELCMSPLVKRPLGSPSNFSHKDKIAQADLLAKHPETEREVNGSPDPKTKDDGVYLAAPAASCTHITFAVAAEYCVSSATSLRKLLDAVPGASLTVFSGVGSLGITPFAVQDIITAFGKTRCFLDLRVSKPCRSCGQAGMCVVH